MIHSPHAATHGRHGAMHNDLVEFVCPQCHARLRVPRRFLGQRGSCRHCGVRIALIASEKAGFPQFASRVEAAERGHQAAPATEAQQGALRDLGAPAQAAAALDRRDASDAIARLGAQRAAAEPPTERQLEYLRKLGADPEAVAALASKAAAGALIEAMHLKPTLQQIQLLQRLGATGGQIAALRSQGEAEALIHRLRRGQ